MGCDASHQILFEGINLQLHFNLCNLITMQNKGTLQSASTFSPPQASEWCKRLTVALFWDDQYFFLWMLMMWWHPTWILGQLFQESEVFRREIAPGSTSWDCSLEWIAINVYQITSSRLLYPPSSVIQSQRIQMGHYLLSN